MKGIIQELISNIIRHANATEVQLQCSQDDDLLLITVEDNGSGFDVKNLSGSDGLGLKNVINRVDFFKGSIDFSSRMNKGTIVNIALNVVE